MKILFVEPHESSLFSFRKELLDTLLAEGHQILLCIETTKKISDYYGSKLRIINVPMNLKDKGIFSNVRLINKYKKIIKDEKPELIISYKIKPNVYCGLCAKRIPMIANITGLGNMFKRKGILSKIGIFLYRKSFKNIKYVFFQNQDGYNFFLKNHIKINKFKIIPGSGVNTKKYTPTPINKKNKVVSFLFASRAIEEKGFDLLIKAIPNVLKTNINVHFNFLSAEEDIYTNDKLKSLLCLYPTHITILDRTDNMNLIYRENDFLVSPSYYREGISNVLLESLACGRPIITTMDNPGCMEVLQEGINGIGVLSNNLSSLNDALIKASYFSKEKIEEMGIAGRKYVVNNFERALVIKSYLDVIKEIKKDF